MAAYANGIARRVNLVRNASTSRPWRIAAHDVDAFHRGSAPLRLRVEKRMTNHYAQSENALAAIACTSSRRGLGSGRLSEGLHGNALVPHLEDLQLLRTARRVQDHAIAGSGVSSTRGPAATTS